ncbi:MAG: redoxin domain-containing protein [Ilumatobacter sp.]|uniref:redoxin domain-containing protein n=1 Tax=Ilumatobacter sp. TaxID=1967498 RepID=UPI003297E333
MDARRIAAVISLGLVGAVVVGLVATSGDGSDADVEASVEQEPSDTSIDDSVAAPTAEPVVDAAGDTVVDSTAPVATDAAPGAVVATPPPTPLDPNTPDLPDRGPHPEFLDVQEWLQTDATSFEDFDGKVLAVQFWTFGCSNCQATYEHMRDLHAKYAGDDFEVIGVHAPEFDHERDVDSVAAAARDNGLVWPIAIDNEKLNFRSWQERRFWPRLFLIDADGNVRYDHIGEGAYDEIDAAVGALIDEKNA